MRSSVFKKLLMSVSLLMTPFASLNASSNVGSLVIDGGSPSSSYSSEVGFTYFETGTTNKANPLTDTNGGFEVYQYAGSLGRINFKSASLHTGDGTGILATEIIPGDLAGKTYDKQSFAQDLKTKWVYESGTKKSGWGTDEILSVLTSNVSSDNSRRGGAVKKNYKMIFTSALMATVLPHQLIGYPIKMEFSGGTSGDGGRMKVALNHTGGAANGTMDLYFGVGCYRHTGQTTSTSPVGDAEVCDVYESNRYSPMGLHNVLQTSIGKGFVNYKIPGGGETNEPFANTADKKKKGLTPEIGHRTAGLIIALNKIVFSNTFKPGTYSITAGTSLTVNFKIL